MFVSWKNRGRFRLDIDKKKSITFQNTGKILFGSFENVVKWGNFDDFVRKKLYKKGKDPILTFRKKANFQRPKSRPLHEFYNDDDIELETLAKQRDPTAPRPEGAMMTPVRGENPRETNGNSSSAQTQPRSLDRFRFFSWLPIESVT